MAKVTGGLAEFTSGKLGNVVFVKREGKTYVRMAPEYTKDSWTPRQKQHRERFRLVNSFCLQFKFNIIKPIWNLKPGSGSGYNRFIKANMPAFGLDGKLVDKSGLHFSDGVLPVPYHFIVEKSETGANKIAVSWENDMLMSSVYEKDDLLLVTSFGERFNGPYNTGKRRSELKAILELPEESSPVQAVYLFFASYDRKKYSPDKYFELK
jgi:hypothetical protein